MTKLNIFLSLLFIANSSMAANRYWVSGTASNWNNTANWSTTSGGIGGTSVPSSADVVYFDANGLGNCTIDAIIDIAGLTIQAGYTSTISQGANTITTGSSNAVFSGGTFTGGTANILLNGNLTISGTNFTSTSATLELRGNYTLSSGSFSHNNGTVKTNGVSTICTGTQTFNNLIIAVQNFGPTVTFDVSSIFTVLGTLTISANVGTWGYYEIAGGTIEAKGDIIVNANCKRVYTGSATILINGTGNQNLIGYTTNDYFFSIPNLTINKPSGTLFIMNNITISRNLNYIAGTINYGTSKLFIYQSNQTISGNISLYDVAFVSSTNEITINAGASITTNGTLYFEDNGTWNFTAINGTGVIYAKGNIVHNSICQRDNYSGTANLIINGTGSQLFTGNADFVVGGVAIYTGLPNIEVNKPSGTLTFAGQINLTNDFILTAGTIDAVTNNPIFNYYHYNTTFNGTHTVARAKFTSSSGGTCTVGAGSTITVNGALEFYSGGTWDFYALNGGGIVEAKGDITINGTSQRFDVGNVTLLIDGTANQLLTGASATSRHFLPKVTINKPSGTLTITNNVSVSNDWTYTQGMVDAVTNNSTVYFNGGGLTINLDGQGTSTVMDFNNVIIGFGTTILQGELDVDGNLTLLGAWNNKLDVNNTGNYTIKLRSNFIDEGAGDYFYERNGTVIFDGVGNQTISCPNRTPPVIFHNIQLNKPSGKVILSTPVEIVNLATFTNGTMTTDATNLLIFKDNSTTTGASNLSFVQGPIKKTGNDIFTFPVGKNDTSYAPISITAPANTTDAFTAEYFGSTPNVLYDISLKDITINHLSDCEYWILDRTTGTSNVSVGLSWASRSCGVDVITDLKVARWDGAMWKDHGNGGTTGTTASGTVLTSAAVTTFSPFTLASRSISNPLPVELLYFDAQWENSNYNKVIIEWATASEVNNDYFEIERSVDGINFTPISHVIGSGNSNSTVYYSEIDNNPLNKATSYYRLKQVDFNGVFSYSNIVAINAPEGISIINLWPNPSVGELSFFITSTEVDNLNITIVNMEGKTIQRILEPIIEGVSIIKVNTQQIASGYYFIRAETDGGYIDQKQFTVNR